MGSPTEPLAGTGAGAPQSDAKSGISLGALWGSILRVGIFGIGDLPPLLAYIERDLIETKQVMTHDDLNEAVTYTKLLPGSTGVQIVAYLGYKLRGWPGALAAALAYVLPATLFMIAIAAAYVSAANLPLLGPALRGLTFGAVGLLLATMWRLSKRNVYRRQPLTVAIMVAAFALGLLPHLNLGLPSAITNVLGNVAIVTIGAGLIGAVVLAGGPATGPKAVAK